MGVSQTICPCWSWTVILLIAAPQVARVMGVSHQHLAIFLWIERPSVSLFWVQMELTSAQVRVQCESLSPVCDHHSDGGLENPPSPTNTRLSCTLQSGQEPLKVTAVLISLCPLGPVPFSKSSWEGYHRVCSLLCLASVIQNCLWDLPLWLCIVLGSPFLLLYSSPSYGYTGMYLFLFLLMNTEIVSTLGDHGFGTCLLVDRSSFGFPWEWGYASLVCIWLG
jgi:hypothetical protein